MNYLFLVLLLIATGCNSNTQTIPILDFAEALKNPEDFNLSDYAEEITYVGLETRDDCLLSGRYVAKINNDLYIKSGGYYNGQMYKFSMTGKFICPIGRMGFGPEEYSELLHWAVSPAGNIIYIMNHHDILKYNSIGEFIERIPGVLKRTSGIRTAPTVIDNQGRLFFRHRDAAFRDDAVSIYDSSFKLLREYKRKVIRTTTGLSASQPITYDGTFVYYHEHLGDTLYAIDSDLNRRAVAILDMGTEQLQLDSYDSREKCQGKRRLIRKHFMNNLWFLGSTNTWLYQNIPDSFIYLKESDRLIYLKEPFVELEGIDWHPMGHTSDEWILRVDMVSLLDNRDKISDPKLKALAMKMNENSNPILAVVKLKKHF